MPSNGIQAPLLQISGAYWAACTLHAGVKLDLLSAILTEWRSSQQSWG